MALSAGTRLGPYEILALLGTGGMGEVYRATDTRLGRTVAIKLLRAAHSDRFEREARAIAALNHPHICTLHDIGPDYLVMEYVEGAPLRGPLPPEETVRLAWQIADALEAAHQKGIIHRDLKPSNILMTGSGIKLLDFGLAKLQEATQPTESTVTQTQAGTIVGTAAYMSPEQVESRQVDPRSDIFSFGTVLYEMLSGRRAFGGATSVSTMVAVLHGEPEWLQGPPEIESIIKRCLRKNPADRYQTAAELKAALKAVNLGPAERIPSIAVLPFANMSGDKDNEYFSDGLAEEIINGLTKLRGLKVAARSSAFAFKGRNEDIRRIGQALSVAHILEGSVRKAGNRLRVTAQLIAIADGCHLWSERYDRELTDVFAIQDEISQAIVDVLKVKLGPQAGQEQRLTPRRRVNMAAYQAYLEGRYHFLQLTEAGLIRSRDCLESAIAVDPGYAAAYAGLAECYIYLNLYTSTSADELIPKAMAAAEHAIRLDPDASEGYVARGFIRGASQRYWAGANEDFEKALQLKPDSALAHYRRGFWYFLPMGRTEEVLREAERAMELDPLSILVRCVYSLALHVAGRNEMAVQHARSALQLFPDSFLACLLAGWTLGGNGLLDEATGVLQRGLQANPGNVWLLTDLAAIYGRQGKDGEVERILRDLEAREDLPALVLGAVHAASGNLDLAFRWLDRAVEEHHIWTSAVLRVPLLCEPLIGPRYEALLRKMKLA